MYLFDFLTDLSTVSIMSPAYGGPWQSVDPQHLKSPSTSTKVLTKTWNQRYKQVDSTEERQKKVQFHIVLKEIMKGKGTDPKPNSKPSKSNLRPPPKYKTQTEPVICRPVGQQDQDLSEAKIRSIPTLQIPSTLPSNLTAKQELMAWHLKLGHLPFGVIQNAARLGILPHQLTQVKDPPKCPSCLYGSAH